MRSNRHLHLFLPYITPHRFHRPGPAWRLPQLKPTALHYLFQTLPRRSVARRALALVVNTRTTPSIYAYVPSIGLLFLFFTSRITGCLSLVLVSWCQWPHIFLVRCHRPKHVVKIVGTWQSRNAAGCHWQQAPCTVTLKSRMRGAYMRENKVRLWTGMMRGYRF